MDTILTFDIKKRMLGEYEKKLEELTRGWLIDENNLDVLILSFAYADMWSISIDCHYLKNEFEVQKTKRLTIQLFDRLNIPYSIT